MLKQVQHDEQSVIASAAKQSSAAITDAGGKTPWIAASLRSQIN
jgi:hypothetical protein